MEEFCGSPFWDSQLTWNTTNPYLTPCFENSVLGLVPIVFLLAFGWTDLLNFRRSKERQKITYTLIFIGKCLTNVGILVVICQHFIRLNIVDLSENLKDADLIVPMCQILGYVGILLLSLLTRSRLISSSGTQFFFWFLTLATQVVLFRTAVDKYKNESTKESIVYLSRIISFPMVTLRFLLEFWQDAQRPEGIESSKIPIGNPSPDQTSTFASKLFFLWYDRLAWEGYRGRLTQDNLWDLNPSDSSQCQSTRFRKLWNEEISGRKSRPSILRPLARCYGPTYAYSLALKLCGDLIVFIQPELIRLLVAYISSDTEEEWKGYLYTSGLFLGVLIQSILNAAAMKKTVLVGMRIRTALSNAVYRKSLFISNGAKMESTAGETQNLMSVDAQKFVELLPFLTTASTAPIQIGVSIYLLHNTLGPSVFAGLGVLLLLIPINGVVAGIARKFQMEQMKLKDQRIKLSSEVLGGIKVLKLYAWETSFQKQIEKIRAQELVSLRKAAFLNTFTVFIFLCAPVLVATATFSTYVLSDSSHVLNAEKTYVSMSLFNIIRLPMITLPMALAVLIQTMVSVNRLNNYLTKPELDKSAVSHDESYEDPIVIENGTFHWNTGDESPPTLRDINLRVRKGELLAIVGTIGSGKSTLLSTLLGDLTKGPGGFVNVKGSLAYVSQSAWIQNATLRNNVLFGDPFNTHRYNQVLEACALKSDLSILSHGDQTEIGEKGINLSGGQKQRVSLARAAYKQSDIYLFDDPLSAVDSHVGKHIFENVIGSAGILSSSTRILVTHGVQYLPLVDRIVVMKDGRINEVGNYRELLQKKGEFADFLLLHLGGGDGAGVDENGGIESEDEIGADRKSLLQDLESVLGAEELKRRRSSITATAPHPAPASRQNSRLSTRSRTKSEAEPEPPAPRQQQPKLIEDETTALGNTKLSVFLDYFKSAGIGLSLVALVFNAIGNGLLGYSNIWLAEWSTQSTLEEMATGTTDPGTTTKYLSGYGAIGGAQALSTLIGSVALALVSLEATRTLHNNGLKRLLRAPMSYFDTTLLGRLINRLSREVDIMDNIIPLTLRAFINMLFSVLATFVVISIKLPIFIAFIIPMGFVYFFLQVRKSKSCCLDTGAWFYVLKTFFFHGALATFPKGGKVVKAPCFLPFFQRFYVSTSRQLKRWESVTRSPICSHFGETISGSSTIRAFSLEQDFINESERRIDRNSQSFFPFMMSSMWISIRLEFLGGLIIFFTCLLTILTRESMAPGSAGLAISYALSITSVLNLLARQTTDLETNIVSVERLTELTTVPQEAPWEKEGSKVGPDWPPRGEVEFKDYSTRYREGLELVVKGINCRIRAGERIGVVGRTGAGKSSLTLALFRLVEPAGGSIRIDGLDVSELGLTDLRSKITIIPQDPVLFSGSLRMNLDPFARYSDPEVWRALELSHLKPYVLTLGAAGLGYKVEEEGKNFSVGQRQLICLARALLRRTKILVLDEATAGVDLETDDLIQGTIRAEFIGATIITIAHRLHTILDSSRVLVLERGEIKEFDSPDSLLANPESLFHSMAQDAKII